MDELLRTGQQALYLVLLLSAWPIAVATLIGLAIGMLQTLFQLQEQTLVFGIKLFGVLLCLLLLAGWYGETLLGFGREALRLALRSG